MFFPKVACFKSRIMNLAYKENYYKINDLISLEKLLPNHNLITFSFQGALSKKSKKNQILIILKLTRDNINNIYKMRLKHYYREI